ncbi:MAG: hypothetical protein AAF490_19710 [Chloroflexota bacterium]
MNANGKSQPQANAQNRKAYLLRVWREDEHDSWRIMLQAVDEEKRQLFTNIEAFISHLEEQYKYGRFTETKK